MNKEFHEDFQIFSVEGMEDQDQNSILAVSDGNGLYHVLTVADFFEAIEKVSLHIHLSD